MLDQIARAGHRLTAPRRAIVGALAGRRGYFRAEEILAEAKRAAPGTGRATVYRMLEILSELGLVEQLHLGEGNHGFVLGRRGHHHHLICSICGRVMEFQGCGLPEEISSIAEEHQFRIEGHQLEVYGRCWSCS